MSSYNINITGDLFLGRRIESSAIDNPESLFDTKILNLFINSDFNIINLEGPLSNAGIEHKILKTGPNLKASPNTIGVLDLLKIDLAALANNHIYDYGSKGLSDTLEVCKKHNIATVGAGLNLAKAKEIFFKKNDQVTIGVINIAENEWSNATESHGGANPMNLVANTRAIHEAKKIADLVLLIIHGGHEWYSYPSPRMVDQYHYYAEEGASLIVCHHSHCISGYEIYNQVPIFYGLGNFLFDYNTDFEGWYKGVLLSLQINQQKEISWELHPYQQCIGNLKVELLEGQEKLKIENKIKDINAIISDPVLLKEKFDGLIDAQRKYLLSVFSTSHIFKNYYLRSAIRKFRLERFFLRREQLKLIQNYSRCESLKDVASNVIDNYIMLK